METAYILSTLLFALLCLAFIESKIHKKNISKIKVRIHVNGTRGKSSVTRLIAAVLRSEGYRTLGKTTGTLPRYILPDGTDRTIYRSAKPNIIEQRNVFSLASKLNCDAVVVECMALQPKLQWVSESALIYATHTVITNVKADHLEVMGPTVEDVAWALAGSTPKNGKLFCGSQEFFKIFQEVCRDRNTELILPIHSNPESVLADPSTEFEQTEILSQFSYIEHWENIALALKVVESLGISRDRALQAMTRVNPDPGAMTHSVIVQNEKKIHFINGFAANDPGSSKIVREVAERKLGKKDSEILIMNLREDRPERSVQLAEEINTWEGISGIITIGLGQEIFWDTIDAEKRKQIQSESWENLDLEELYETILEWTKIESLVLGLGNIAGPGMEILRFFSNRKISIRKSE